MLFRIEVVDDGDVGRRTGGLVSTPIAGKRWSTKLVLGSIGIRSISDQWRPSSELVIAVIDVSGLTSTNRRSDDDSNHGASTRDATHIRPSTVATFGTDDGVEEVTARLESGAVSS